VIDFSRPEPLASATFAFRSSDHDFLKEFSDQDCRIWAEETSIQKKQPAGVCAPVHGRPTGHHAPPLSPSPVERWTVPRPPAGQPPPLPAPRQLSLDACCAPALLACMDGPWDDAAPAASCPLPHWKLPESPLTAQQQDSQPQHAETPLRSAGGIRRSSCGGKPEKDASLYTIHATKEGRRAWPRRQRPSAVGSGARGRPR
jgi:hypothetical protein